MGGIQVVRPLLASLFILALISIVRHSCLTRFVFIPRNLLPFTQTFMKLHNKLIDDNPGWEFNDAMLEVQRTWQFVVRSDLMPQFFDGNVLSEIERPGYRPILYTGRMAAENRMPVEHSAAVYRLFHSRLAGGYFFRFDGVTSVRLLSVSSPLGKILPSLMLVCLDSFV